MSTRSQVHIIGCGEGGGNDANIMLYHHCDGYPTYMVPTIQKALKEVNKPHKLGDVEYNDGWKGGRPGKAASFLCASDPGGYEVENHQELHGDIEFLYILRVSSDQKGANWVVQIRVPLDGFWDDSTTDKTKVIQNFTPVEGLTEKDLARLAS